MTFGAKLQKLRKARGWTQEQLAEQIQVSRQALSKWELNSAVPDTENVVQLSRLFGVTTDYLLAEDVQGGAAAPSSRWRGGLRVVTGVCLTAVSGISLLLLGILASVFPAVYAYAPVGVEWVRVYDGLSGFLITHHLVWLFVLLCLTLLAGAVLLCYPRLSAFFRAKRKKSPVSD